MGTSDFFEESRAQSQVKSRIVAKYFSAWANVIKVNTDRLGYIDLFAGAGRYKDGTPSTPLLVLDKVAQSRELQQKFVSLFCEKDPDNYSSLRDAILSHPGVSTLRHPPKILNHEVGHETADFFSGKRLIPSLLFADPCGYKSLSRELLASVAKDWASECIFFFNYNRINAGLSNPLIAEHMDAIFGKSRADDLRACLPELTPAQREKAVMSELRAALAETYGRFVVSFRFDSRDGRRTSHYLVHITKKQIGYELMKEIMGKESACFAQGVPSFHYSPMAQVSLPNLLRPLDDLASDLRRVFAGKKLTMVQVYHGHNVGTPYVKKNYKDAMLQLEREGLLRVERKSSKVDTLADDAIVSFPNQE